VLGFLELLNKDPKKMVALIKKMRAAMIAPEDKAVKTEEDTQPGAMEPNFDPHMRMREDSPEGEVAPNFKKGRVVQHVGGVLAFRKLHVTTLIFYFLRKPK
jgi:hypothetical protein